MKPVGGRGGMLPGGKPKGGGGIGRGMPKGGGGGKFCGKLGGICGGPAGSVAVNNGPK